MENALLELKEKMKLVYAGYGSYLVVLFKFLLALVVFEEINGILPYVEVLDQLFVVLLAVRRIRKLRAVKRQTQAKEE